MLQWRILLAAAFLARLMATDAFALQGAYRAMSLRQHNAYSSFSVRRTNAVVSLNMNLGERFFRLIRANFNELLNRREDPEKLLNQVVEDMQKELIEFRQTYAEVAASQKRLERQRAQAEGLMEEWLKRAKLALQKGDEEAARAALERKNQQQDLAASLSTQIKAQGQAVSNLYAKMQQLEAKITEAKAKKDQLKARAQTAKVATKISDILSKTTSSGALEAFERMQDKVEAMEAQAEIAGELSGDLGMDDRFRRLEASSKVEDDLAELKGLLGGGVAPTRVLMAEVLPRDGKVELELQRMKDLMG